MAKRQGQFQLKQPVHKYAKLTTAINRGASTSTATASATSTSVCKKPAVRNDIWGDEEDDSTDDFIFLASQVVDRIETESQQILTHGMTCEESFSHRQHEFRTSTQQVNPNIDNFFNDDDDELLIEIPDKHNDINHAIGAKHQEPNSEPSTSTSRNSQRLNDQSETKALMKLLEDERKHRQRLEKEKQLLQENLQNKDGEVNILRYKIDRITKDRKEQDLNRTLLQERSKNDLQQKLQNAEGELFRTKAQLVGKDTEILRLENRLLSTPQRKPDAQINHFQMNVIGPLQKTTTDIIINSEIFNSDMNQSGSNTYTLYIPPFEKKCLKQLSDLQSLLSKVSNSKGEESFATWDHYQISSAFSEICKSSAELLKIHVKNMNPRQFLDAGFESNIEYEFLCHSMNIVSVEDYLNNNLLGTKFVTPNEILITLRRIIAGIAMLCRYNIELCIFLLDQDLMENMSFTKSVISSLNDIALSKQIASHYGLFEAISLILLETSRTITQMNDNRIRQLINFFKSIVLCRPNGRTLHILSQFLLEMSNNEQKVQIIKDLSNEEYQSIHANEKYKIVQFTNDTCPLQIYAALIEGEFFTYSQLTKSVFQLINNVLDNLLKFLRNCLKFKVHWIQSQANIHIITYGKLCASIIILSHMCIEGWLRNNELMELNKISRTAQMITLFLHDSLYFNYQREIFQIGGNGVKNRVQVLLDRLSDEENQKMFQLKSIHLKALSFVDLDSIISNPLYTDDTPKSPNAGDILWDQILSEFEFS